MRNRKINGQDPSQTLKGKGKASGKAPQTPQTPQAPQTLSAQDWTDKGSRVWKDFAKSLTALQDALSEYRRNLKTSPSLPDSLSRLSEALTEARSEALSHFEEARKDPIGSGINLPHSLFRSESAKDKALPTMGPVWVLSNLKGEGSASFAECVRRTRA